MGFSDHFPRWQLGLRPGFASGGARRVVLEVLLRATGEVRVVLQAMGKYGKAMDLAMESWKKTWDTYELDHSGILELKNSGISMEN